jgi:hypothetical protein
MRALGWSYEPLKGRGGSRLVRHQPTGVVAVIGQEQALVA